MGPRGTRLKERNHHSARDRQAPNGEYKSSADSKIVSIFLSVFVVLFFLAALSLVVLTVNRATKSCENTIVQEVLSEGGTLKAILFKRQCYGESTMGGVAVMERMKFTLRGGSDVLRVPGNDLAEISVRWERPRTLIIRHPAAKPIRLRMKSFITQFGRVTVREDPD
jgi:hypothetical protein